MAIDSNGILHIDYDNETFDEILDNVATALMDYRVTTDPGQVARDVGILCMSPNVNAGSKYKPFKSSVEYFATDSEKENALTAVGMGWKIPCTQTPTTLKNDTYKWQYQRPSSVYRLGDYDRYYHKAQDIFLTQNMGEKLTINAMNPFPGLMSFYVYQRTGGMADHKRGPYGISAETYGRTATQLSYTLGTEDLTIQNSAGAYNAFSLYEEDAQLGIIIPSSDGLTYKSDFCELPLSIPSDWNDASEKVGMYRKELIDLGLESGTHTAIACLRWPTGVAGIQGQSFYYIRLQDAEGYPSKFTIEVSGVDKMLYTISGIALTDTATTWSTSVVTANQRYIYVKIVVKNTSGITITNTDAYQLRWNLKTTIKGSKIIAGASSSTAIDIVATSSIHKWRIVGTSTWNSGATSLISIDNNKSVELIFRVDNIYNDSASLDLLGDARVSFGFSPCFDDDKFTYNGSSQLQTYTATYN